MDSYIMLDHLIGILIIGAVFLFIFAILREFWCWFFKFNAILDELKAVRKLLEKSNAPPQN